MRVIGKQHQRCEAGRTDRITFRDRLRGVAHGIKRIGNGAHRFRHVRHFSNAAGVIRDRAISVERDDDARHRQHRRGGNGNAVQATQLI